MPSKNCNVAGWHGAALPRSNFIAVRFCHGAAPGEQTAMSMNSEQFSLRHARRLTLGVLIIIAAAITLANLSLKVATIDFLKKTYLVVEEGERPFGWPLTWYWRIGGNAAEAPRWPVSRFSSPCLIGNVAMWLAMLASAAIVCQWLLRRYPPSFRGRPRVSTLIPLVLV
ncbi:MAG TPA: hypothetical protein VGX78_04080, partial [Pirellulales bacterium]|nr:hypothetical protein [Pirellulales bacterium]